MVSVSHVLPQSAAPTDANPSHAAEVSPQLSTSPAIAGEVARSASEGIQQAKPSPGLRPTSPTKVGEVRIPARVGEVRIPRDWER